MCWGGRGTRIQKIEDQALSLGTIPALLVDSPESSPDVGLVRLGSEGWVEVKEGSERSWSDTTPNVSLWFLMGHLVEARTQQKALEHISCKVNS